MGRGGSSGWLGSWFLGPASWLEEVAVATSGVSLPPGGEHGVMPAPGRSGGLVNGAAPLSYFLGVELEGSRPLFFSKQQPPDTLLGQVSPLLS